MKATKIVRIGFEVAATLLAAVAAFMGVRRTFKDSDRTVKTDSFVAVDPDTGVILGKCEAPKDLTPDENSTISEKDAQAQAIQNQKLEVSNALKDNVGLVMVDSLRKTQKLSTGFTELIQAVSGVAETFVRLFDKSGSRFLSAIEPAAQCMNQQPPGSMMGGLPRAYYFNGQPQQYGNPYSGQWSVGPGVVPPPPTVPEGTYPKSSLYQEGNPLFPYGQRFTSSDGHFCQRLDDNQIGVW